MSSESEEEMMEQCTPSELRLAAKEAGNDLLPEKSRQRYKKAYGVYKDWAAEKGAHRASENVMLAYFKEMATKWKPSTLWATYSMLRSTLLIEEQTNIAEYPKLQAFLKKANVGYKPKKSKVFSAEHIEKFITEAPRDFLPQKVALILGVSGACRSDELFKMKFSDLDVGQRSISVQIPETKTHRPRAFVITRQEWIDVVNIFLYNRQKVITDSDRLFLQWRYGKMTRQPFGHNSIGQFPQKIAKYLNLAEAEMFTGHCFRRTSATLLANTGGDILQLKRLGGWKSNTVAEGYVESSRSGQIKISELVSARPLATARPEQGKSSATSHLPRSSPCPSTITRPPCSPCPGEASRSFSPCPFPRPSTPTCASTSIAQQFDIQQSSGTSTQQQNINFSSEQIKQGLSLSIKSYDQSKITINFNNCDKDKVTFT